MISRQLFLVGTKISVTLSSYSSCSSFSSLVTSLLLSGRNALKVQNLLQLKFVFANLTEIEIGQISSIWIQTNTYRVSAMCPALCKLSSHILFLLNA